MLPFVASLAALLPLIVAHPSDYEGESGCEVPAQGFEGHGAPVTSPFISFSLANSTGDPVSTWVPGDVYTLTTFSGGRQLVEAWMHASAGTLTATSGGQQSRNCQNAWGSRGGAARSHDMAWEAPATGSDCSTFTTAQATSEHGDFQINWVTMCVEGVTPPASKVAPIDVKRPMTTDEIIHVAHASMMLIAWAVLIPCGVVVANTMRADGPVWFTIHRALSGLGLIASLASFVLAYVYFQLPLTSPHVYLGFAVMALGLLQPMNAAIRPKGPDEVNGRTTRRVLWELFHKSVGYITIALAAFVSVLGFRLGYSPFLRQQPMWWRLFIGLWVGVAVLWIVLLARRYLKARMQAKQDDV